MWTANRILETSGIIDDASKIYHASSFLTDSALHYFQAYEKSNKIKTWNDFSNYMLLKYRPLDHEQGTREKLKTLKQTRDIDEYINEFRVILYRISRMEEEDKISYFTDGLHYITGDLKILRKL